MSVPPTARLRRGSGAARLALLAGVALGAACSAGDSPTAEDERPSASLVGVISADSSLSTFGRIVEISPWSGTLTAPGPITVLAPSDEAFSRLPPEVVQAMLTDPGLAGATVSRQAAAGRLTQDVLAAMGEVVNAAGDTLPVSGHGTRVGDAAILRGDIPAANGVLHVVSAVFPGWAPDGPPTRGATIRIVAPVFDADPLGLGGLRAVIADGRRTLAVDQDDFGTVCRAAGSCETATPPLRVGPGRIALSISVVEPDDSLFHAREVEVAAGQAMELILLKLFSADQVDCDGTCPEPLTTVPFAKGDHELLVFWREAP